MDFTKDYLLHDQYVTINENDSVLKPIVLRLPDPPDLKSIDGYGLPKWEQKFKRLETPTKIKLIEDRARRKIQELNDQNKNRNLNGHEIQKEFWRLIDEEKDSLEEEINWIKHIHWYLRYGYWVYIYGKPTWITPFHFFYLNFFYLDDASMYPEYRDSDRRMEIYEWYTYTCTETFKDIDEKGNALSMEMIDVGRRVFFGTTQPKRRRKGISSSSVAHGIWIAMHERSAYCEIVADTGEHAKKLFTEKLAPAWYHMELFIKPVWDGDERPSKALRFIHPKTAAKEDCLGSVFSYTESSTTNANQTRKLKFILSDEEGLGALRADVNKRWNVNKKAMSLMDRIIGYSNHPSTIEEMAEGGAEFHNMFNLSNFYVRNSSGKTASGLTRIFFKAEDGADGYIDPWGYSVIETPTEDQIKYAVKDEKGEYPSYVSRNIGAKQYLDEELSILLSDGSPEKLKDYRENLRMNPRDSEDCWRGQAGDMGFNIIILDKAISDAKYKEITSGNFEWQGGIQDTRVVWKEDKSKGKFEVSDLFIGRNNLYRVGQTSYRNPNTGERISSRKPQFPTLTTAGIDSFRWRPVNKFIEAKYGETTSLSDGGGAVLLNFDSSIDGQRTESEWETHRFICTYRNRPSLDEFCEDMLKMCVYYGSPCIGERNTEYIIDYFIKRGYAGYIMYLMDVNGKEQSQPWVFSGGGSSIPKGDMLSFTRKHIDDHGHKECHVELLTEWKNLREPDDLNTKDLAAAAGWALYGYEKGSTRKHEMIDKSRVIQLENSIFRPRKM